MKEYEVDFYKDNANEHRWRVQAGNGKIIAASTEGYKTRADARENLASIHRALSVHFSHLWYAEEI